MIPLKSDKVILENDIKETLDKKQKAINDLSTFTEKSKKAIRAWDSKNSPEIFKRIKEHLISLCVSVEVCNYCESNEANDIEHIFPKKLFPHKTFTWTNYLLSCQNCNSKFKQDLFAIFDPWDSEDVTEFVARQKVENEPTTEDCVFINPREEDPMDFLWLELNTGVFNIHPDCMENSRGFKKAEYTLRTLQLNKRSTLVEGRKATRNEYLNLLKQYVLAKQSLDFQSLEEAVHGFPAVNRTIPFSEEKQNITTSIEQKIKTHRHPTVWRELVRQKDLHSFTRELFAKAPEVVLW